MGGSRGTPARETPRTRDGDDRGTARREPRSTPRRDGGEGVGMSGLGSYRAHIFDEPRGFLHDTVRLIVRGPIGEVGMADGTWTVIPEGEDIPEGAGWEFPRAAIEEIARAIADWQGDTSHADTEGRIFREWLNA